MSEYSQKAHLLTQVGFLFSCLHHPSRNGDSLITIEGPTSQINDNIAHELFFTLGEKYSRGKHYYGTISSTDLQKHCRVN